MANISRTAAMQRLHQIRRQARQLMDSEEMFDADYHKWHRDAEVAIENIFGRESRHIKDFNIIQFEPQHAEPTPQEEIDVYEDGLERAQGIIQSMVDEIRVYGLPSDNVDRSPSSLITPKGTKPTSNRVFVVHGHDEAMKQSVARVLEKLGLKPIILHDQPNKGRTIIEKFTNYSDVSFAVILLSPDDLAFTGTMAPSSAKPRARQNVILELGFFLGRLGRDRVFPLYCGDRNFEIPSDYSGVIYTPFDEAGSWRVELLRELKSCGFNVDANILL